MEIDQQTTLQMSFEPLTSEQVLNHLKQERDKLTAIIEYSQQQITRLQGALSALEGKTPPAKVVTVPREGKSIVAMIEEAALAFGPLEVFDAQSLATKAIELNPSADAFKIKRGCYNAINALTAKRKIFKCPNGYRRDPIHDTL